MSKVSDAVKEIVSSNPYIQNVLADNLLSISRYAALIKNDVENVVGHSVQTNAIVMALRRYSSILNTNNINRENANYKIEVRTNIYNINLSNKSIDLLVDSLRKCSSAFINSSLGNSEISISIDEESKDQILNNIDKSYILHQEGDLASLTLVFDDNFLLTYGIIFELVRKLALNKININEIYSTLHELTFVVKREDSMKAYSLLQELKL